MTVIQVFYFRPPRRSLRRVTRQAAQGGVSNRPGQSMSYGEREVMGPGIGLNCSRATPGTSSNPNALNPASMAVIVELCPPEMITDLNAPASGVTVPML